MKRASISISAPNDEWIQSQIEREEYSSRSEVVNDLIRKARKEQEESEYIRSKLMVSEKSLEEHGFVNKTPPEMLDAFKKKARRDGKL